MEPTDIQSILQEYKSCLLEGNKEEIVDYKAKLSAVQLQEIDEWFAKCKKLVEKAKRMAHSGSRPGDLSHTALQKQSMELGDVAYGHINKIFMESYQAYQEEQKEAKLKKAQSKQKENQKLILLIYRYSYCTYPRNYIGLKHLKFYRIIR